jgi:hypothetical protein
VTELVSFTGNDAASKLVQWAEAASAAQALAQQLCRTAFVPETFRLAVGESEAVQTENGVRIGNATAALLLGAELGLDPIASLRAVYVIRGQVAIYARMKLALLLSRGHRVWTEFESDERITVAGYRKDDAEHVQRVTWDVERAKRAGFTRNELYRTNPRAMLFARASSELASRLAPDVLAGIPEETAEELGAVLSAPENVAGASVTVQRPKRASEASGRLLPVAPPVQPSGEDTRAEARAAQEKAEEPAAVEQTSDELPEPEELVAERVQTETLDVELPEDEPKITSAQRAILHALFRAQGWSQDTYRQFTRTTLGRALETTSELSVTEASFMIERMKELSGENDDAEDVEAH